jgi:L-lactate utilization protein LutB
VARILHERSGVEVPAWVARGETAEPAVREALARDLSLAARRILRRRFLEADVGVTGANFLVAESGTVVLVENEANIRLTTCLPGRHVVLAGIDKIVPRDEDLGALLRLLPVSATGQRQSGYVSLLADRHTDLHVVLVDNGRSALRRDPEMRDVLTCIRCGACLNACPVYRCIGGHAYGGAYPGPIGALLLPLLGGLERFADLPFASSLCGACSEACPAAIPLHERLLRLRARLVERGRARDLGWTLRRATSAMRSAARMESGARLYRAGRFLLPLLPVARRWARERDLPPAPRETFRAWWARERGGTGRPARPAAAAPRRAEPDRPPPAKPAAPPEDVAARFARRLAELGPAGETEYHRFARAGELRAFLRERLVGTDPAALIVDGERPERRDYAVGITGAAALVADTGGVVVDPASREAALASLLVDTHVVVADPSRFVEGVAELHRLRAEKRARGEWGGLQVVATGPSRTADIEKTLVIPAHGPRRMIVLLCDEPVDPATLRPAR